MRSRRCPKLDASGAITAAWLGQDGQSPAGPGDVHVVFSRPAGRLRDRGAVLTDSSRGVWIYRANDRVPLPRDPSAEPLAMKLRCRSQVGRPVLSASIASRRARHVDAQADRRRTGEARWSGSPGGSCDLSKRSPSPRTDAASRPSRATTFRLWSIAMERWSFAKGTYRLTRPLVLNRPVTLTSEGGATLLFAQAGDEPPGPAAIKIHCGNTTLERLRRPFRGPDPLEQRRVRGARP